MSTDERRYQSSSNSERGPWGRSGNSSWWGESGNPIERERAKAKDFGNSVFSYKRFDSSDIICIASRKSGGQGGSGLLCNGVRAVGVPLRILRIMGLLRVVGHWLGLEGFGAVKTRPRRDPIHDRSMFT